jgi:hypothetical protein
MLHAHFFEHGTACPSVPALNVFRTMYISDSIMYVLVVSKIKKERHEGGGEGVSETVTQQYVRRFCVSTPPPPFFLLSGTSVQGSKYVCWCSLHMSLYKLMIAHLVKKLLALAEPEG